MQVTHIKISKLKPHPKNYNHHPEDQINHIVAMIQLAKDFGIETGIYRNIVISKDCTILAGHGVVQAAKQVGLNTIPVMQLDIDANDPRALKVLTGDNEIGHLREVDDRMLSDLLKNIRDSDLTDLIGTGYDDRMLANLVMVTRPASEVVDFNAAAEWVGMPEYDETEAMVPLKIVVNCRSDADRESLLQKLGNPQVFKPQGPKAAWSFWWPPKPTEDVHSLRFEDDPNS